MNPLSPLSQTVAVLVLTVKDLFVCQHSQLNKNINGLTMMASRLAHTVSQKLVDTTAKAFFIRVYTNSAATFQDSSMADRCDLHIVSSPYPQIESGPYPPIAEFVTADWGPRGHLNEQIAILDHTTGLSRTFTDYRNTTSSVAAALQQDFDVNDNSAVALYAPNHVDYLPISLAVSLCGAKLVPINPLYKEDELDCILQQSRASVLITHTLGIDVALNVAKRSKTVKHVVVITDDENYSVPEGTTNFASLQNHPAAFSKTIQQVHSKTSTHTYLLPYSSGTTGLPKGVCISHQNLIANLMQLDEAEGLSFPSNHKLITPLPFFHIYGFMASMFYCAWRGQQVITNSGMFDLESFCRVVEEHQPQRAHLVPPIMVGLAKNPLVDQYDLSSLQMIITAAAPIGEEIERATVERLNCDVKQAWGMSELSPLGTWNSDFNFRTGSVGPLVSSTYAKIVDKDGNSLGPHKDGELVIKGPQVMMGYLDNAEKTEECLSKDGWLRTGDVAHYDEDGFIYIMDRIKELIKVRGFQVAPAELEALLLTNEHVSDAAVIQVPDEVSGELPRAYIVLKSSSEITQGDIKEWVEERVAPHKRLEGGIEFCEMIPKSASGKILRRILRDQWKVETESSSSQ